MPPKAAPAKAKGLVAWTVRIWDSSDPNLKQAMKDKVKDKGGKIITDMRGLLGFLFTMKAGKAHPLREEVRAGKCLVEKHEITDAGVESEHDEEDTDEDENDEEENNEEETDEEETDEEDNDEDDGVLVNE